MDNSTLLTLVVTSSFDATTDVLLRNSAIPIERIFRLNYDLISDYTISVTPSALTIVDPVGRVADLSSIHKCYLRKFERKITEKCQDKYADEELWYVIRSIIHQLWSLGHVVLVEPGAETTRLDKLTQLRIACRYFPIADWEFCFRSRSAFTSSVVVKSLSRGKIGEQVLYANRVEPAELDVQWPWFQQEIVEAEYDVTVVYVRGKQFTYRLDRRQIVASGRVDWKSDRAAKGLQTWEYIELPESVSARISSFMQEIKLDFGRLDFLMRKNGELVFLEVNPNGQFAWLDLEDSRGLITAVCNEISPLTPLHPIKYNPFL